MDRCFERFVDELYISFIIPSELLSRGANFQYIKIFVDTFTPSYLRFLGIDRSDYKFLTDRMRREERPGATENIVQNHMLVNVWDIVITTAAWQMMDPSSQLSPP